MYKRQVYNGPFAMTNLVEDNSMTWVKNDQYWDKDNVNLQTINYKIMKSCICLEDGFDDQYKCVTLK